MQNATAQKVVQGASLNVLLLAVLLAQAAPGDQKHRRGWDKNRETPAPTPAHGQFRETGSVPLAQ